ncbi:hypothetical protein TVAG_100750 [Trichomonas vaginalis G3]|uniref:Cilium assembly protein DZIP1 N-terminal domain-containing protein n=1 Tax=Trichomonas vaginalis (strain ATCC PRA-98 / G3) TaxID=412133 RepID=A2ENQ2_TRIV3|nr:zinc finger, C2H2-type family protein [Trichomonas vaginalis G3]EAY05752.1 hypothetical protein TVAG_100750 [Trichomonas vaginalis G3]KAI5535135.1 zinc finger, C2H2-type family protein [Trichomonas vaginalis G3]|eukprot:XP_001317975.1 hypothetical protein [Trichomonas vaginalis G3]
MSEFTNYDPMQGINQFQKENPMNAGSPYPGNYQNQSFQQYPGYPQQPNQQYPQQRGDPMMGMNPQGNYGMPFEFTRRINKMNWEMIGNVDVLTIARTNDIQSIEFLMGPVAFANIGQDDGENFGSRAGLHAFLILQLAVEYLLFKIRTMPPPQPMMPPPQQQPQISPQSQVTYEARIDILTKDIKSRDLIINSLSDKLREAEKTINSLKAKLSSAKESQKSQKKQDPSLSQISIKSIDFPEASSVSNKKSKRNLTKEISAIDPDESGLVHPDTEYVDYNQNKMKIKSKPESKRKGSSKSRKKHDIDYDYSESEIIAPTKPKKKKEKKPAKNGMFDAEWGDSSGWN